MGMVELKLLQDRMNELERKVDEIGKVEHINSNIDIPLNHYFWLQDYKANKDNSYIKQNDAIYTEAMLSSLFMMDPVAGPAALTYLNNMTEGFGTHLKNTFFLSDDVSWEDLPTLLSVTESSEAICEILNNKKARGVLFNSNTFITELLKNPNYAEIIKTSPYGIANKQQKTDSRTTYYQTTITGPMIILDIYLGAYNDYTGDGWYQSGKAGFSCTLYNGSAGPSYGRAGGSGASIKPAGYSSVSASLNVFATRFDMYPCGSSAPCTVSWIPF